jgi:hypothetical protein
MNEWSYTSAPLYTFILHSHNCILLLIIAYNFFSRCRSAFKCNNVNYYLCFSPAYVEYVKILVIKIPILLSFFDSPVIIMHADCAFYQVVKFPVLGDFL